MNITKDTKVAAILKEFPWLKQELIKKNPKFKRLDSPMAKIMLKKATLLDVSKKFGYAPEDIIQRLQKMIDAHNA